MALDASTLRVKVVSEGIKEAAAGLDSLAAASDRAEKATTKLAQSSATTKQNNTSGAASLQALMEKYEKQAALLGANMAQMNAYNAAMLNNSRLLQQSDSAARQAASGTRAHNEAMREAHSLARGLSGSLGALWVTYGNLAGMAVGVALGASLKNLVTIGKDVEYQLRFVQELAGQPIDMDKFIGITSATVVSVKEAAEGLRALAQNGLDAKQSIMVLTDVLNLSVVGEMSVSSAALAMTGVLAAFGLEVSQSTHVVDVFAQTAATSNTSVTALTESMKQASTAASLYHLSLEETAASLGTLAKLNITGGAAGTSMTNFLTGIYTPTKEGAKALLELGISAVDASGKLKNYTELLGELRSKLSKFSEGSQVDFLNDIFTTRGTKFASALISNFESYKTKLHEANTVMGYTAKVVAGLEDTTEGAWKRLGNAVSASMTVAFEKSSPPLQAFLHQLGTIGKSGEAVSALTSLAQAVIRLVIGFLSFLEVIYKLKEPLAAILGVFVALKVAVAIEGLLLSASAGASAVAVSTEAAAVGTTRLATSVGLLQRALGVIALAITAVIVVYELFINSTSKEENAHLRRQNSINGTTEALERELKAIRDVQAAYNEKTGKFDKVVSGKPEGFDSTLANKRMELSRENIAIEERGGIGFKKRIALMQEIRVLEESQMGYTKNRHLAEQNLIEQAVVGVQKKREATINSLEALAARSNIIRDADGKRVQLEEMGNAKTRELGLEALKIKDKLLAGTINQTQASASLLSLERETNKALGQRGEKKGGSGKLKASDDSRKEVVNAFLKDQEFEISAAQKHFAHLGQVADVYHKAGLITDEQYYTGRREQAENLYLAEISVYDKEANALKGYLKQKNHTSDEMTNAASKFEQVENKRQAVKEVRAATNEKIDADEAARAKAISDSVTAQMDKWINATEVGNQAIADETRLLGKSSEVRQIANAQLKVDAELKEYLRQQTKALSSEQIDSLNEEAEARKVMIGVQSATLEMLQTTSKIEQEMSQQHEADLANYLGTEVAKVEAKRASSLAIQEAILNEATVAYYAAESTLTLSSKQIEAYSKMKDAYAKATDSINAQADKALGTAKIQDQTNAYTKLGKTIGDSLSTGFGKAGKAAGDMVKVLSTGYTNMLKEDQSYSDIVKGIQDDKGLTDFQRMESLSEAAKKHNENKVANEEETVGSLISIGKGLFDEHSKGYKLMEFAEKAFMALKVAAAVANMVTDKSYTASSIAMSIARSAWHAIEAVLTQGKGDPYTAFARMAAMAAVVGAIGFAVSGGGGGGSAGKGAEANQKENGTGSTFGDDGAKSQSLSQSLDILSSNSNMALTHTASMRDSLKSIVFNIVGLTNLLVRGSLSSKDLESKYGTGFEQGGSPLSKFANQFSVLGLGAKLWGGTTKTITDSGFTFNKQSFADAVAKGAGARSYVDIETKHSGLSGLLGKITGSKKDSHDRDFGEAGDDDEINQQFTKIIRSFGDTVLAAMTTLGFDLDKSSDLFGGATGSITDRLNSFVVDLGDLSLQGLKGSEMEAAVEAKFGKLGDDMAKWVMPGIEKLSKVGEGALVTLVRVATNFETASYWVKTLGNNTEHVFGAVGLASAKAATNIVELSGGLDKFNSAMESYVAASMTDAQQADMKVSGGQAALDSIFNSEAFKDLGVAAPQSWEEFNKIVNGLDLTTEAGQRMFVTMTTKAAPAFLAVEGSAQKAADAVKSLQQVLDGHRPAKTGAELEAAVKTDQLTVQANSFGGIRTWADVLALTDEQIANMTPTLQQNIKDWANNKAALDAYNKSLKVAKYSYEDAVAAHNGVSETTQAATKHQRDYDAMLESGITGIVSMAQATDASYVASLNLTDAQYELVTAYITSGDEAANLAKAVQGISWGEIAATAQSEFDLLFADVSEAAKVISKGNFAKELGDTASFLSGQLVVLGEKRNAMLQKQGGMSYGNTDQMIAQEMVLAQKKIEELNADLLKYISYESDAITKGHGKALVELDHWHKQQIALAGGNGAKLLLIDKSYAQQREDILKSASESGLNELSNNLNKWLESIKLNSSLSPLTAQQQLEEARRQYNVDLAKARGGDATAIGDITKYAEAFLTAQKAVTGFAGDYSSVFAMVQQQIGQLANPDGAPVVPATSGDITQLKAEVVSLKETLAKTLEKILAATVGQTEKVTTAVTDAGNTTALASNKSANLTATA